MYINIIINVIASELLQVQVCKKYAAFMKWLSSSQVPLIKCA